MFSIEELREMRDSSPENGTSERHLMSRLIFSHLDALHVIEQDEARLLAAGNEITRLQRALTAIKHRVEVALS